MCAVVAAGAAQCAWRGMGMILSFYLLNSHGCCPSLSLSLSAGTRATPISTCWRGRRGCPGTRWVCTLAPGPCTAYTSVGVTELACIACCLLEMRTYPTHTHACMRDRSAYRLLLRVAVVYLFVVLFVLANLDALLFGTESRCMAGCSRIVLCVESLHCLSLSQRWIETATVYWLWPLQYYLIICCHLRYMPLWPPCSKLNGFN